MRFVFLISILFLLSCVSQNENWPMPAGPNGDWSVSAENSIPLNFSVSQDKNILWKSKLPEGGQSGIAVWEDKVFLTVLKPAKNEEESSLVGSDIVALCVDAKDGEILWSHPMNGTAKSRYMFCFSDSSTPGPITDGEKVWFTNASGLISCLDLSGKLLWERKFKPVEELNGVHFPFNKQFEPFIHGDTLVNMEPYWEKDGKREYAWNYLYGLDKNTGELQWISEDSLTHYNTPFAKDGKVLIGRGAYHKVPEKPTGYSMIDLNDGKRIWKYDASIGKAMYVNAFNEKYAIWFTERDSKLHVLNPQNGKLLKEIDIARNAVLRTYNGKSYEKEEGVNIPKKLGVNVFPAWYTNVLVEDDLFFMCFTDKKKKFGPDYCLGKVNLVSGKVEYLQVPVHHNPGGKAIWNTPLTTKTINSRGMDVAHDKRRSTRDGWYWLFTGTPICINKNIYFTTMMGVVYCIDTQTSEFNEDAIVSINDVGPMGKTWTLNSMAYANGRLYHRTLKNLICIGEK